MPMYPALQRGKRSAHRRSRLMRACGWLLLAMLACTAAAAPAKPDAEAKLRAAKAELKRIAAERKDIESRRGDASQQLRQADEQVGATGRALHATEAALVGKQAKLTSLQQRRAQTQAGLAERRAELARLLQAAYREGADAPLKTLLAQDRVNASTRALTYHAYLQRDRAARIRALTAELRAVETLEETIARERRSLDAARVLQRQQLQKLERDLVTRAGTVAQLEGQFRDKRAREQALGRDVKALQALLAQLRAEAARAAKAAARAAKAERAAKAKAERASTAASRPGQPAAGKPKAPATARVAAVSGPPLQVGGLSWPLTGALLAGYGGRMPDGRASSGVLIGAAAGSTVKAVADGRVAFADWMNGYGLIMIVDHGNGYMSLYAHNDALLRDAGDTVKRGEAIAKVGNSGGHGRPALYFELRRAGQPVDPGGWLKRQ